MPPSSSRTAIRSEPLGTHSKRQPAKELSEEVARAVLGALQQAERHLRSRLKSSSFGEDEAADLSKDLGFICAIKGDLERQVVGGC
jgi:hypothetical protein